MLFPLLSCPRSSCEIPHMWQSKLGSQPDFPSISHRFLARGGMWQGEEHQGIHSSPCPRPHCSEASRGSHLRWEWQIEWYRLPHTVFASATWMQEGYFSVAEYHKAKIKNICLSFQSRHHGKDNFLHAKIQTVSHREN